MYLMLDFETLGSAGNTVCVSLGAVAFNRKGVLGKKLFVFDLKDQVKLKRTFTASTLQWWMRPERAEARKVFLDESSPRLTVQQFFPVFEKFVDDCLTKVNERRTDLRPMGNGANFDIVILENLYRESHAEGEDAIPFKFWNVWCYRTLNHVFNLKDMVARPHGTHHTADEDALHQANCVIELFRRQDAKKKKKTETVDEKDF